MSGSVLAQGALGAALTALLEIDAAAVGPFLFSRPFIVGPLVGALFGNCWIGAGLGVAIEVATLEELPLGGRLGISSTVAAGVAVCLAAGPLALPVEASFPAGLVAGWGHAFVERGLRSRRGRRIRRLEDELAAGGSPRLGAAIASALGLQMAATFFLTLGAVLVAGDVISRLWPLLPQTLRSGMTVAVAAAPWLGAGGLAAALRRCP